MCCQKADGLSKSVARSIQKMAPVIVVCSDEKLFIDIVMFGMSITDGVVINEGHI